MVTRALQLAFYADDLTGATDVLEALATGGKRALLLLDTPTPADTIGYDAIGIAGTSRAMPPEWMDQNLPDMFTALGKLGAPLVLYKVCSTFDSSAQTGNIGRVLEIGLRVFACGIVPVVAGVPRNGRYTMFGNLFARDKDGTVHRIDRHPVMSIHPKTPMREADLRRHLAAQTDVPVHLIDFCALVECRGAGIAASALAAGPCGVLIDIFNPATSRAAGALMQNMPFASQTGFVIGSSGAVYALLDAEPGVQHSPFAAAGRVGNILVLSGSASPTTAAQIDFAEKAGFGVLKMPACDIGQNAAGEAELASQAIACLQDGRSVIVATALGPDDPGLRAGETAFAAAGVDSGAALGTALGRIGLRVLQGTRRLRRIVIAGGDTSSFAASAMNIRAIEMVAPCLPGSPLCRVISGDTATAGLEVIFKGGQIGSPQAFLSAMQGIDERRPAANN